MSKIKTFMVFTLISISCFSQSGNLTGSPYSLFGLGVESNSGTGINSGIGRTGIALEAPSSINLYNSASFATILEDRFILDLGMYSELQNIKSGDREEFRFASNFSNLAMAVSLSDKSGAGLSLIPSSSVGYALIGIESTVEGSNDTFRTNIVGSGGINEVRFDYAYSLMKNLSTGIKLSYLFGTIEEDESIITSESLLNIGETNYYNGLKVGLGLQYQFLDNYNFGLVFDFPTNLNGKRDTFVEKLSPSGLSILEDTIDENIENFELPLKFGFGFSTKIKTLQLNADYTFNAWSSTNQSDTIGDYVNQNIFGLGAEYTIDPTSLKYWKRINFRAGLNYNSGYLEVDNTRIDNYEASIGFGIPLGRQSYSLLNISYTSGIRGTTDSFLVEENYNTLNINLTLSNLWFQKRKYN